MKKWISNNKSLVIKLSIILLIAVIAFTLITIFKDPVANWLNEVYTNNPQSEWIFWLCIVVAQVLQAVFLQVSNSLITAPLAVVVSICNPNSIWGLDVEFGIKAFLFSWLGIAIGNIILYLIGRFAGEKILTWFLGDKNKLNNVRAFVSSKEFIIIASINPIIPSDVVNTLSGDAKVSAWFMIPETIISRGICCLTTFCLFFGITLYPWKLAILIPLLIIMVIWSVYATKRALKNVHN